MILYFDEKTLELNVRLGAVEEYTPSDEVKDIIEKADQLKELKEAFIRDEYNPKMTELLNRIDTINCAANPELKKMREQKKT